jgi:hypothetical protein
MAARHALSSDQIDGMGASRFESATDVTGQPAINTSRRADMASELSPLLATAEIDMLIDTHQHPCWHGRDDAALVVVVVRQVVRPDRLVISMVVLPVGVGEGAVEHPVVGQPFLKDDLGGQVLLVGP